jgi:hypothetical protein
LKQKTRKNFREISREANIRQKKGGEKDRIEKQIHAKRCFVPKDHAGVIWFSALDLLVDHRRLFRVAVEQHDEERRKHDYVQSEEVLEGSNQD